MTARFIISFDCEGKWGMADKITEHHQRYFTNANIINVYQKLIAILDKYQIKATFAFVGAFTFSVDQYQSCRHEFKDVLIAGKPWLAEFHKDIKTKNYDGWFVPEAYNFVKKVDVHEIASHGFTHLPLDENSITFEDFKYEMEMIKKHAPYKSDSNLTFIYPRNLVGYPTELLNTGFLGYREALKTNKPTQIFSLLREINFFDKADQSLPYRKPIPIPPGRFLNWRNGPRKMIPVSVTVKRWKEMLKNAIKTHGILHLWSHPHNFIDGDNMFFLFEEILKIVAEAQKRGEVKSITQRDYCLQF